MFKPKEKQEIRKHDAFVVMKKNHDDNCYFNKL